MTEQLTVGGLIYELKKLDSSLLVWCASKRMRVKPAVEVILCTEKSSKCGEAPMTKAKKLPHPKVWLVFDDEGRLTDWANHRIGIAKSEERVYAYAPAKPAKVCKCKEPFSGPLCLYCANCGGKVKR